MINKKYKKYLLALLIACSTATPARASWFVNPFSIVTYHKVTTYMLNFMQTHPAIATAMVGLGIVVGGIELAIFDAKKDIKKHLPTSTTIAQQDTEIQNNTTKITELKGIASVLQGTLDSERQKQEAKKTYDAQRIQLTQLKAKDKSIQDALASEQNKLAELNKQLTQEQAKLKRLQRTIDFIKQDTTEQQEQDKKARNEKPAHAQQAVTPKVFVAHAAQQESLQRNVDVELDSLFRILTDIKNSRIVAFKVEKLNELTKRVAALKKAPQLSQEAQARIQEIERKIAKRESEINKQPSGLQKLFGFGGKK